MNLERKWVEQVVCDNCGYHNEKQYVDRSGICNGCGKILDPQVKFKAVLCEKLHLGRKNKWKYWNLHKKS